MYRVDLDLGHSSRANKANPDAIRSNVEGNNRTPLLVIESKSSNSEPITPTKLKESEIFSIIS
jgi:mRNA-degrading endonuclease toxin of MazEF toxin-antitoxin module